MFDTGTTQSWTSTEGGDLGGDPCDLLGFPRVRRPCVSPHSFEGLIRRLLSDTCVRIPHRFNPEILPDRTSPENPSTRDQDTPSSRTKEGPSIDLGFGESPSVHRDVPPVNTGPR